MSGKRENVATTLNPIFYFTKLFGLTPFNSNADDLWVLILNLVWCSLQIFWNFYVQYKFILYVTQEGIVLGVMDYLISSLIFITFAVSILKSCFSKNTILKVISSLSEIDNSIKTLNLYDYKAFLNYKRRKYLFVVIIIAALSFLLTLAYFLYIDVVQIYYLFFIPSLCPGFVVMQFCAIGLLIKDRFTLLNHEITRMAQTYNTAINLSTITSQVNLEKIQNILILHEKLCFLSKLLNKIYSIPILSFITLQFIIIFNLAFYSILKIIYEQVTPILYIINVIYCSFSLFALIIISSLASNEANKIRFLLDPILISRNKLLSSKVKNTLNCVTNFYLQLLESKLKFTACGLFILNENLIYDIFAAIVQYSIILLEFELVLNSGIIAKPEQ